MGVTNNTGSLLYYYVSTINSVWTQNVISVVLVFALSSIVAVWWHTTAFGQPLLTEGMNDARPWRWWRSGVHEQEANTPAELLVIMEGRMLKNLRTCRLKRWRRFCECQSV